MVEEQVCGHTVEQGGEFEWVCVLPPHETRTLKGMNGSHDRDVSNHYYRAFKKVA